MVCSICNEEVDLLIKIDGVARCEWCHDKAQGI